MQANEMRSNFLLQYEGAQLANRTFNDREISAFLNKAQSEIIKRRFSFDKNSKGKGFEADNIRRAELAGVITAHKAFKRTNNDFMIGTEDNGALRTPDLDSQLPSTDQYGVFCRIPDEVLYIILESCSVKQGNCIVNNVPVQEITYGVYMNGITNYFKRPYKNLVWAMDWGTYTTSGSNGNEISTKFGDTNVVPGATPSDLTGFKGKSTLDGVTDVLIRTNRSRLLIPGKDWEIDKYNLHYIKEPSSIVVDILTPSQQRHCELASFMHQEIIDYAIKLAAASIAPEQNKYEINTIESSQDE